MLACKYCANLQDCIENANLSGCEHNPDFEGERYCKSFKRKDLENGCEHCANSKKIATDIDGDIEIVKMIPLPAIDLMTGETEEKTDPPYWAMRLMLDGGEDFAKIYFCPICGRELPGQ